MDDYNFYLGEIRAFAFNKVPDGWLPCNGQSLPVSQNQALFALLGTTYGGDGKVTFSVPDLRGRVILHRGTYEVYTPHTRLGEAGGAEKVLLTVATVPAHNHSFRVVYGTGTGMLNSTAPGAQYLAAFPEVPQVPNEKINVFVPQARMTALQQLNTYTIGPAGGNEPHENRMPYLPVLLCIATKGIFPPRE